jgi:F0F1-type ATP synthase assembly protein I
MIPSDRTPENGNWAAVFNTKALTVGGEVGCLTLIIVILSVFGGIWLDRILGTKPLFIISLVLLSAPISLVLTYWIAKRAVKDMNPSLIAQSKPEQSEEEKTGE